MKVQISLRFYEELNDFLSKENRYKTCTYFVESNTTIKDVIESLGVPHTEVDLILVNGISVDFKYQIQAKNEISIYPVFESFDISEIARLRPRPLRKIKFVLDVHLGKLAKYLRLLGFDTLYERNFTDQEIIGLSLKEKRIILTRDIGLLKNKIVKRGTWIRNIEPNKQTVEVLNRFDLYNLAQPFTRCTLCNGKLIAVDKKNIVHQIPPLVLKFCDRYQLCLSCKKIYWHGTHFKKLKNLVKNFLMNKSS